MVAGHPRPERYFEKVFFRLRAARLVVSEQKTLGAEALHDAQAVFGADFVLHAVEVIFHCLLGKAEVIRDFLVREPFGDQRNDLLLAPRQSQELPGSMRSRV